MKRGDVVLVPFPYQDKPGEKIRPAAIVQSDQENRRLANTILAMITGNLADAGQPTTVLVDPATPDGAGSGKRIGRFPLIFNNQRSSMEVVPGTYHGLLSGVPVPVSGRARALQGVHPRRPSRLGLPSPYLGENLS
jgi:hypothetical protein